MKASIIIPVYNTALYLRQCVESVLQQTYTNFEIILVDDGSTDTSPELCDQLEQEDNRILVIHQANGGASVARNSALARVSGDIIFFLDSDDYWKAKDGLETVVNIFSRTSCDLVEYACWKFWNNSSKIIQESHPEAYSTWNSGAEKERLLTQLLRQGALTASPCNKAIRRTLFENFDLSFREGVIAEDIDWTVRLMLALDSVVSIVKPIYAIRKREKSVTAEMNPDKFSQLIGNLQYIHKRWKSISYVEEFMSIAVCNAILDMSRLEYRTWKFFRPAVMELCFYLRCGTIRRVRLMHLIVTIFGLYGTCLLARFVRIIKMNFKLL